MTMLMTTAKYPPVLREGGEGEKCV